MRSCPISRVPFLLLALGLLLLALPGCGDDDDDDNPVNPGTSTQLTGTFASPPEGGLMTISIQSASLAPSRRAGSVGSHTVTATAVLTPEIGAPFNVAGTYSEESDSLYLTGGGYNMAGLYDAASAAIRGSFGGPKGAGSFVCAVGGSSVVEVYCGAFEDDDDVTRGRWNLVISGTQLWGIGALHSGFFYDFEGTVTGTGGTRTILVGKQPTQSGHDVSAEGTIDGTGLAQGTWSSSVEDIAINTGPWSAAACETGGQMTELTGMILHSSIIDHVFIAIGSSTLAPARPAASLGVDKVPAVARVVLQGEYLSGFYDLETDSLDLAGVPTMTMVGKYEASGLVPGIFGRFTAAGLPFLSAVGGTDTVKSLCGSFENSGQTTSGSWGFLVVGESATGMAVSTGAEFRFEGTVTGTGTTRTITLAGSDGEGGTLTATGTLDATTYTVTNGSWSIEVDSTPVDSGTWGGELCGGEVTP